MDFNRIGPLANLKEMKKKVKEEMKKILYKKTYYTIDEFWTHHLS